MNSIRKGTSLYLTAAALIGLPLLAASGGAAAQTATASSPATNFNPPPCDYSDQFYQDNGLDPTQVVGRFGTSRLTGPPATGSQVNWVADPTCSTNDPDRRNFRILATTGGFTDNGTTAPNAFISILGFVTTPNAFESAYTRTVGGSTISITNSDNPRGEAMMDIVSNFEAYALVKQRLPNGVFATNPCDPEMASPLAPPTPCFQLNTVNTVYTPNLRQDWRFAQNRNAMDGSDGLPPASDGNCIDDTLCQGAINDSPYGYFCDDLLGMWIVTYVWYTVDPANPGPMCTPVLQDLANRNGISLDGSPIIKTPADTNDDLEANGCGAEGQVAADSEPTGGVGWLVCPAIPDPRNGAIAKDAFLDSVHLPNGQPQNPQMTANFLSLQRTGQFPNGGDGS
jgi:hypothetical protein